MGLARRALVSCTVCTRVVGDVAVAGVALEGEEACKFLCSLRDRTPERELERERGRRDRAQATVKQLAGRCGTQEREDYGLRFVLGIPSPTTKKSSTNTKDG